MGVMPALNLMPCAWSVSGYGHVSFSSDWSVGDSTTYVGWRKLGTCASVRMYVRAYICIPQSLCSLHCDALH